MKKHLISYFKGGNQSTYDFSLNLVLTKLKFPFTCLQIVYPQIRSRRYVRWLHDIIEKTFKNYDKRKSVWRKKTRLKISSDVKEGRNLQLDMEWANQTNLRQE